ncbi:hypothetical protein PspR32_04600 [Pseudomonas sp. R32]|nr:hypothetical protein COO64_03995 [Pseudomonas donghuensis]QHF27103.1 hypothetical protein PspR32_04600 [Pseudomonas sp. R32]
MESGLYSKPVELDVAHPPMGKRFATGRIQSDIAILTQVQAIVVISLMASPSSDFVSQASIGMAKTAEPERLR